MTQTIMLRFGLSYWKSVYPHFEWFSPRNDDKFEVNPNFLAKTLAYKDGKEIKEFLPIFISLAIRLHSIIKIICIVLNSYILMSIKTISY